MDIQIKRIYEKAANRDGTRILVDRVWPRGVSKEEKHNQAVVLKEYLEDQ